jgi:hypothetical protein
MTKRDRIETEKVIAAIRAVFQKVMKSRGRAVVPVSYLKNPRGCPWLNDQCPGLMTGREKRRGSWEGG